MKMYTKEQFNEEKNAKNRAYLFILLMGLFYPFQKFCEKTDDLDEQEIWYLINLNLSELSEEKKISKEIKNNSL